jgi:hypothetical protein
MAAMPDQEAGLTIKIPVCWLQHQKERDSSFMLDEEWALFQMHISYISLGRKLEIITLKWTVKYMPAD